MTFKLDNHDELVAALNDGAWLDITDPETNESQFRVKVLATRSDKISEMVIAAQNRDILESQKPISQRKVRLTTDLIHDVEDIIAAMVVEIDGLVDEKDAPLLATRETVKMLINHPRMLHFADQVQRFANDVENFIPPLSADLSPKLNADTGKAST